MTETGYSYSIGLTSNKQLQQLNLKLEVLYVSMQAHNFTK